MTYGGYGGGLTGPFGNDPFGGQGGFPPQGGPPGFPPGPPGGPPGYPPGFGPQPGPPGPPTGQTNTLATLSIPFGIILPPLGAVLGHMGLSQVKRTGQPGRERALIGLTLSYLMIFVGIVALVVWLVLSNSSDSTPSNDTTTSKTTTKKTTTTRTTTKRSTPRSTAPPPPPRPQQVTVDQLKVGDCVQIEEHGADRTDPNAKSISITMSMCLQIPGIYHVDRVTATEGTCPGDTLFNTEKTTFVCVSPYRG